MNHPSQYHHPLFLLTDDGYNATGAVEVTAGRYIGRDTTGRVIFDRKDYAGALTAARKAAARIVSASWHGIPTGRPADHTDLAPPRAERLALLDRLAARELQR